MDEPREALHALSRARLSATWENSSGGVTDYVALPVRKS